MARDGQYHGRHWRKHKPRIGKTPAERKKMARIAQRQRRNEGKKEIRKWKYKKNIRSYRGSPIFTGTVTNGRLMCLRNRAVRIMPLRNPPASSLDFTLLGCPEDHIPPRP